MCGELGARGDGATELVGDFVRSTANGDARSATHADLGPSTHGEHATRLAAQIPAGRSGIFPTRPIGYEERIERVARASARPGNAPIHRYHSSAIFIGRRGTRVCAPTTSGVRFCVHLCEPGCRLPDPDDLGAPVPDRVARHRPRVRVPRGRAHLRVVGIGVGHGVRRSPRPEGRVDRPFRRGVEHRPDAVHG